MMSKFLDVFWPTPSPLPKFHSHVESENLLVKLQGRKFHTFYELLGKTQILIFQYDKNINQNIINFILDKKTFNESLFNNYKNNKMSEDFDTIERLAIKNRYLGWFPKYRKDLRLKYKNNNIDPKFHYTFLSFLRGYKRLIFN